MNEITVNAQSSIRIDNEHVIYFDPFMISEEKHDADIIFFTHEHYDHYSKEDYMKVAKEDTIYVMPKSMGNDFDNIAILLNPDDKSNILGIQVEAFRAYNIDKPYHPKDNNWLGYKLDLKGYSIYVCGDTDYVPELKNVKCDILFTPIGGKFTMDYKEAANLTNDIKPKKVIPIHYGSVVGTKEDFDKFKELVNEDIEVIKKL